MLSPDSPSTSAHLLTIHDRVLREQPKLVFSNRLKELYLSRQQQDHCLSCGTIRIPAVTCTVSTRSTKGVRSSGSRVAKPSDPESSIIYNCLRCHRRTIQPFKKQLRPSLLKETKLVSSDSQQHDTSPNSESRVETGVNAGIKGGADNASSKKRAKARKQQGLLAALAASKPSRHSSSTSLGLPDFLQL